jgi:hypothetical protein
MMTDYTELLSAGNIQKARTTDDKCLACGGNYAEKYGYNSIINYELFFLKEVEMQKPKHVHYNLPSKRPCTYRTSVIYST